MVPKTQQQWICRSRDFTEVLKGNNRGGVAMGPREGEQGSTHLEALAVLVALKLQFGETPGEGRSSGNGAALNKLMTTKFPASALPMELSRYMKKMSIRTVVVWVPREWNKEADRLANGVFEDFDPTLRIRVCAGGLQCEILPQALAAGRAAEDRFQGVQHREDSSQTDQRKRKVIDRLKMTDPW